MDRVLEDIDLEFKGFSHIPSSCYIDVYSNAEGCSPKLIIVCKQKEDYSGTSITNGFEEIVESVSKHEKVISLVDQTPALLEMICQNIVQWYEVYPKGYLFAKKSIQQVRLDSGCSPIWGSPLNDSEIIKIGLNPTDIFGIYENDSYK